MNHSSSDVLTGFGKPKKLTICSSQEKYSRVPNPLENIATHLREHIQVIERLCVEHLDSISIAGKQIVESLESGGTIFWCGNGGSASDSQHLAAEFVGRFKKIGRRSDRLHSQLIHRCLHVSQTTIALKKFSLDNLRL